MHLQHLPLPHYRRFAILCHLWRECRWITRLPHWHLHDLHDRLRYLEHCIHRYYNLPQQCDASNDRWTRICAREVLNYDLVPPFPLRFSLTNALLRYSNLLFSIARRSNDRSGLLRGTELYSVDSAASDFHLLHAPLNFQGPETPRIAAKPYPSTTKISEQRHSHYACSRRKR